MSNDAAFALEVEQELERMKRQRRPAVPQVSEVASRVPQDEIDAAVKAAARDQRELQKQRARIERAGGAVVRR